MARQVKARDLAPILSAAKHWIETCLIGDGSLFGGGQLWTAPTVDEAYDAFVGHPDESDAKFQTKLTKQIEGCSSDVKKLVSEMLWVQLLFPNNSKPKTKRDQVIDIWSLSGAVFSEAHPLLSDDVLIGVGSGGPAYATMRPNELEFLMEVTRDLKRRERSKRQKILSDYDSFMDWIESVPRKGHRQFRHMLRFFAFPDRVESISSNNERRNILQGFGVAPRTETKKWSDRRLDDEMLRLRNRLQEGNSELVDFYQTPFKEKWAQPIDDEEEEVDSKNSADDSLESRLRKHLTRQDVLDALSALDRGEPHAFGPSSTYDLVEDRRSYPPKAVLGLAARRIMQRQLQPNEFAGGEHTWAFELLRKLGFIIVEKGQTAAKITELVQSYSLEDARKDLFAPYETLSSIVTALRRKRNVIIQGPPGVGKSFAAKRIAYACLGESDATRVEMVQFHQSYSYEDFVQGWRPKPDGGFELRTGVFVDFCDRARERPDKKFVFIIDEINRGNLSKIFGELMLLIEADKRDLAIPLTYAKSRDDRFSVPKNVHLLGLMNTADRSLALVDYALRRRFVFFSLKPSLDSDSFASQLAEAGASIDLIDRMRKNVGALNRKISEDADLGEGFLIGHSYFCPTADDGPVGPDWYQTVIDTEIAPLIREYWFDKKQADLDAIIGQVRDLS